MQRDPSTFEKYMILAVKIRSCRGSIFTHKADRLQHLKGIFESLRARTRSLFFFFFLFLTRTKPAACKFVKLPPPMLAIKLLSATLKRRPKFFNCTAQMSTLLLLTFFPVKQEAPNFICIYRIAKRPLM